MANNYINTASTSINNAATIASRTNTLSSSDTFKSNADNVENAMNTIDDISGAVKDPVGATIKKVLSKINNISVKLESKIDKLIEDTLKSVDGKGRVEINGNTIYIVVQRSEVQSATAVQSNVTNNIQSINNHLTVLKNTLDSLVIVGKTIRSIQTALDIKEMLMLSNPATAATFKLSKVIIKTLFTKEILKEHSKLLLSEIQANRQIFERLSSKFRNINVQIKISDDSNSGKITSDPVAKQLIADSLLSSQEGINNLYQEYSNQNGDFILSIERYGEDQNIGKAKDKYSGLLKAQTAPSYFATGDQLMEELKNILDIL
jgi:hypothetical protein